MFFVGCQGYIKPIYRNNRKLTQMNVLVVGGMAPTLNPKKQVGLRSLQTGCQRFVRSRTGTPGQFGGVQGGRCVHVVFPLDGT